MDNTTSTESDPQFNYLNEGIYEVLLISSSSGNNCSDTVSHSIEVVQPKHELNIDLMSIYEDGKILIILNNSGSYLYDENNAKLNFSFDNGASISEMLNKSVYPQKTVYYSPGLTLNDIGNSKSLCVEVVYNEPGETLTLDSDCLNLIDAPVIIEAYPNPATDELNFNVVLLEESTVQISLIDQMGSTVLVSSHNGVAGLNLFKIETNSFRSGIYIVKIVIGDTINELKIVIDN